MSESAANAVSAIPGLIGYTPDQGTVVALCSDSNGIVGATLTLDFNDGQTTDGYALDLDRAATVLQRSDLTTAIVVAHSADAAPFAQQVTTALATRNSGAISALTVITANGLASALVNNQWTEPAPVPDHRLDFIVEGVDIAHSRSQLVSRFERDPIPSWSAPNENIRQTIENLPTSDRIAAAKMWLIELTGDGTSATPDEYARLAHLVDTSQSARDVVTAFASRSTDSADVLHAAYVTAPDEYQDVLGAAAGLSHLIAYRDTLGARRMLTEVSPASPHHNLARLSFAMMEAPLTPGDIRAIVERVSTVHDPGAHIDRAEVEALANLSKRILPQVAPNGAAHHVVEQRGPVPITHGRSTPSAEPDLGW